jgi:prepilin-type N-terminal cleavage/methylation domain-containing protein
MKHYPVLISLRSSDRGFTLVELMVAMVISLQRSVSTMTVFLTTKLLTMTQITLLSWNGEVLQTPVMYI